MVQSGHTLSCGGIWHEPSEAETEEQQAAVKLELSVMAKRRDAVDRLSDAASAVDGRTPG